MSKAKFDAAKELIREGQYAQARMLLESIDHPQAKEWLKKLSNQEAASFVPLVPAKKKRRRGGCLGAVTGLACGVIVCTYAVTGNPLPKQDNSVVAAAATAVPTRVLYTETPAPTATITETPLPTTTPEPSATPNPQDQAQAIIHEGVALAEINSVSVVDVGSPKLLAVEFNMMQGFSGYEVDYTGKQILVMACALYQNGFAQDWQYQFSAMVDLIDRSTGKTSTDDGLTVRVKSETVAGWDCANAEFMDAKLAVDDYILNPVMAR